MNRTIHVNKINWTLERDKSVASWKFGADAYFFGFLSSGKCLLFMVEPHSLSSRSELAFIYCAIVFELVSPVYGPKVWSPNYFLSKKISVENSIQ